jgi:hypothetical protein
MPPRSRTARVPSAVQPQSQTHHRARSGRNSCYVDESTFLSFNTITPARVVSLPDQAEEIIDLDKIDDDEAACQPQPDSEISPVTPPSSISSTSALDIAYCFSAKGTEERRTCKLCQYVSVFKLYTNTRFGPSERDMRKIRNHGQYGTTPTRRVIPLYVDT